MTQPRLSVQNIVTNYGPIEVLKDITFDVAAGETFAVIGPNGAGKTTLFKTLTGEVRANAGRMLYNGTDITRMPPDLRVRQGLGRTFQVARIFLEYTVVQNLTVAIEARNSARESWRRSLIVRPRSETLDEAHQIACSLALGAKFDTSSSLLSHGDRKRLEIGITLALAAETLVLDEPSAGMSPQDRHEAIALVREARDAHRLTVLITEHDMGVVFGLADRILVMNYGRMVALGDVESIRNNQAVRELYLGAEEMNGA